MLQEDITEKKEIKWTSNIEQSLKDLKELCDKYKKINILQSRKEARKYNILQYIMLFLCPISGVLSSIQNQAVMVIIIITSFLTTGISSILKFSKFNQRATLYKSLGGKYSSLHLNIERQLNLQKEDRISAHTYFNWVCKEFDELYQLNPIIDGNKKDVEDVKIIVQKDDKKDDKKVDINDTFNDKKMNYELSRFN
jgi:hypothetical protein